MVHSSHSEKREELAAGATRRDGHDTNSPACTPRKMNEFTVKSPKPKGFNNRVPETHPAPTVGEPTFLTPGGGVARVVITRVDNFCLLYNLSRKARQHQSAILRLLSFATA